MFYSQVGQTAAVVPFSVAGKSTAQVQYEYQGIRSAAFPVAIVAAQPGVFSQDSSGQGAGAIVDASGQVVTQSNPARRWDVISLFITGDGVTVPSSADGQVLVSGPYPLVAVTPQVKIGGIDCPVQYAGGASGLLVGVSQVNALISGDVVRESRR